MLVRLSLSRKPKVVQAGVAPGPPFFQEQKMGDISAYTAKPEESETVRRIMEWHKKTGDAEPRRTYLGASILGTECERALWYAFRWCADPDFSGRLYRLFETGQHEEARLVRDLRAIGCTVHEVDPETGEQFAVSDIGGHFKGHADGVAVNIPEAPATWHLLEFKTSSDKLFKEVKAKGVKASKPSHYVQMMVYMGKLGLKRALYLVKNKDTDELYAERVRYDASEYKQYIDKARRVIEATMPPERIANRQDSFLCRFCDANALCWNTSKTAAVPLPCVSCRSCCHATPEMDGDGRWSCNYHKKDLSRDDQELACVRHLLIPGLVAFATPTDAGDTWIEFTNTDDHAVWTHGCRDTDFTTQELISGMGPLVGEVKAVAEVFGETGADIFDRYPPEDCRLVWEGTDDDEEVHNAMVIHIVDLHADGACVAEGQSNKCDWFEFHGHWLLVRYPSENYAAIFEGVL
jgi:hypothetical protein